MAQWEPLPTTLTQFGPLSSEVSQNSGLLSRLWRKTKDDSGSGNGSQSSSREVSEEKEITRICRSSSLVSTASSVSDKCLEETDGPERTQLEKSTSQDQSSVRTLSNVLNRLSNILDRRTSTPQAYRDSDFKQFWMPDSSCRECYDCGDRFTTFRRRHHCRICGQIFCSKCCNQELPGRIIGYKGGIRVCTYCGKVAMSALQAEPEGNLHVEREDLGLSIDSDSGIWGTKKQDTVRNTTTSSLNTAETVPFDVTPQSEFSCSEHFDTIDRKILEDSVQLRELWRMVVDVEKGVEMQNHRIRLRTYNHCVAGNKLVDWLIKKDKAAQRLQAVAIGQAFLDAGFLETVAGQPMLFHDDFTLYKPSETSPVDEENDEILGTDNSSQQNTEPEWFKEIQTDYNEDYSASEDHAERTDSSKTKSDSHGIFASTSSTASQKVDDPDFEPLPRQELPPSGVQEDIITDSMFSGSQTIPACKLTSMTRGWRYAEGLKDENAEKKSYLRLKAAHQDHIRSLINQKLSEEGLARSWSNIIFGTAERISHYVHPDVKIEGDHMDVRRYVKFKKIPGGNKEQTCMVHGLVFTKNIAHKKMAHQITNPMILLLRGSVEYQRRANKFSSLEPQILQEEEFLQKNVAKISSLKPKPDIVVVEKSVSRLAQNYLLQAGITLIYNVKMVIMERLERFTQASMVSSIDGLVSGPITLGFCHNFKVCNFTLPKGITKTMLCFDGCATHLGCTVTLRGGTLNELKKLKSIMKTMVYVAYHSQLEISFCMDEFGIPVTHDEELSTEDGTEEVMNTTPQRVLKPSSKHPSDCDLNATMMDKVKSGIDIAAHFQELESEKNDMTVIAEHFCDVEDGEDDMEMAEKVLNESIHISLGYDDDSSENHEIEQTYESIKTDVTNKIDISRQLAEEYVQSELAFDKEISLEGKESPSLNTDNVLRYEERRILEDTTLAENKDSLKQGVPLKMCSKQSSSKMVDDHSDPLHNYLKSQDESIFHSSETLQEKTLKLCQKFRKILNETLLTTSPYIQYSVPILVSEEGSNCCNRRYFPEEMYWSSLLENQSTQQSKRQRVQEIDIPHYLPTPWSEVEVMEAHPLVMYQLTSPVHDKKIQRMLADFRARGGRIKLKPPDTQRGQMFWSENQDKNRKTTLYKRKGTDGDASPTKSSKRKDCFDFSRHQRLAVLLSSHSQKSANHPYPCLPPQVVTMEFYGSQDITLGGFLEKFCFRESYSCQPYSCPSAECDIPMLDHVRRIVHGDGAIYISLRRLTNIVPGGDKSIMMWNWCRKCKQATPLMPMSMDSWNMSFAKYLELKFYGTCFVRRVGSEPCSHSLHQYFTQYFGHKNIVATFKFYPVYKREISLPPSVISLDESVQKVHYLRLREEVKAITKSTTEMYSNVFETIMNTTLDTQTESITKLISDYKSIITSEKSRVRDLADSINQKLQNIWLNIETNQKDMTAELYFTQDDVVKIKRLSADAIHNWNSKLQELYTQQKKYRQQTGRKDRDGTQAVLMEEDSRSTSSSPRFSMSEDVSSTMSLNSDEEYQNCESDIAASVESDTYSVTPGLKADSTANEGEDKEKSEALMVNNEFTSSENEVVGDIKTKSPASSSSTKISMLSNNVKRATDDLLDSQQVDRIGGLKKTLSNLWSGTGSAAILQCNYSQHHQLPVGRVPVLVYDQETSSIIAYALSCHDYYSKLQDIQSLINNSQKETSYSGGRNTKDVESVPESADQVRKSGGRRVLSFLRGTAVKEVSPKMPRKQQETVDSVKYTPASDTDSIEIEELDGFSILSTGLTESDKSNRYGKPATSPHIELQFSDHTARFYCKVYFAEQFRQLRKLIFPAGEEIYIRSLSRCKIWDARGGKSGSAFCKTDDNRFILKQMSSIEIEIFEKFGFEYFKYISNCHMEQKPTALAKIVGVYKIGFRNTHTNCAMRQDLLVMENLFYGRKISQTFDLKGSMRNRLVNTSGKREEELVLLDENLLKLSVDSPLYVYPHSKAVLEAAIRQDSQFLSANLVMDYSLLVGYDEARKELVVGIIDYIRTFTWDKRLETLIKSTGGKLPTVVSPEIYRSRFLEAIGMQYFLPVPDQWTGLGHDIE